MRGCLALTECFASESAAALLGGWVHLPNRIVPGCFGPKACWSIRGIGRRTKTSRTRTGIPPRRGTLPRAPRASCAATTVHGAPTLNCIVRYSVYENS